MKRTSFIKPLFALLMVLAFIGCIEPQGHPPKNPYMEDRTQGWTAVLPTEDMLGIYGLKYGSYKSDLIIQLLRKVNDQPSTTAAISNENDAAEAMQALMLHRYDASVQIDDIHVFHSRDEHFWIIEYNPYYAAFDKEGELQFFVDIDACWYLKSKKETAKTFIGKLLSDKFVLMYYYDIAQLTLDELREYGRAELGKTAWYRKYFDDFFKTETPTVGQVFENAIVIANETAVVDSFDDKFVVYTNKANDAWIVRSNIWMAAFSMETGELVYIDVCYTKDRSYRTQ